MQLTGTQFTRTAAVFGNDISTLPDFPAEIRAPAGSLPGVSGFQISFSSTDIHTPGDAARRPRGDEPGRAQDEHRRPAGGRRAHRQQRRLHARPTSTRRPTRRNPLTDGSLKAVHDRSRSPSRPLNERSLDGLDMTSKQKDLTKNFFALGIMFWLYERSMDPTTRLDRRRSSAPGRSSPRPTSGPSRPATRSARRPRSSTPTTGSSRPSCRPGTYRNITGNEATALGFLAASKLADRPLFYGSYPITPASDILHQLSGYKAFGVKTFQAEDEIAAIGAAIGASYGGALGHDRLVRPGHRPQDRGDGPRGHGRAAARRHRRPARRPVDRDADEERAGRPAPGDVRAQLRLAACRSSRRRRPASASTSPSRRAASRSST